MEMIRTFYGMQPLIACLLFVGLILGGSFTLWFIWWLRELTKPDREWLCPDCDFEWVDDKIKKIKVCGKCR